ncbi:MAG TPA: EAL domain-containing protein [Acidimicrobiales bacterium]|nr:EAL domain-containing protein [Acidimicrobiales bacterium]
MTPEQKLTVTSEFLNNIRTGMIFRDTRGVVIECNRAAEDILGRSRDVLLGTSIPQFEGHAIHLDGTRLQFDQTWVTRALASNRPGSIVAGFEVPNRICRWLSIRFWPAVVNGKVVGLMTSFEDVTRKVNGERFLKLLNRVKDAANLGGSDDELLQQVCDAVVEEGHYSLAWIGATSSDGGVEILCTSGANDYVFSGMVSWWGSSEAGLGPAGTALRTSTTQVANDLLTEPRFGPWRERAQEFGLSSMISLPLQLGSRRATLSIYDEHAEAFDEVSIKGLEAIAREIESGVDAAISLRQRQVAVEESTAAANALKRAELSLSESEQWFRTLVARSSDLIVVVDETGIFTYTNPIVDKLFGYEKYSLVGRNIFDLIHPQDQKLAERAYFDALEPKGMEHPVVIRFRTAEGEWRFVECLLTNCLGDQAVNGIVGNGRDVTERTYLTRALQTLSEGNQVLVHAKNEDELIADICHAIVTVGDYPLTWVGYLQHDEDKTVNVVAKAGQTGILDGLRFGWGDNDLGLGPIGEAIRTGGVQINDMLTMNTAPERHARVHEFDLRSVCAFPLQLHGETIGMIAIYSEQPNYFGPNEVDTLGELAAELAYGIEGLRDRDQLAINEALTREAEQRFRLAFEHNMAPMLFSDLEDRVIAVNDSFCRMVGFAREELMGHDSKQFTYPDDVGITEETLNRLSSEQIDQVRYVKRYLRKDGRIIISEVSRSPARDEMGKILYFVSSERDITEERTLAEQLSHQALHDSLTGLANRALFEDRLTQAHARLARQGGYGAVLLLDLDDFKGVNDAHGHLVGDQLLTGLARRFEFVTRSSDTLSRFGGDEFLYLAEGLGSPREAEDVASRLIDVLAEPFTINGLNLEQHASIGVVVFDGKGEDSSELIQRADVALYEAKRQNRGRFAMFTASMHQQAVSHFELVQELRRALQNGELSMHYQPIIDLETTRVVGFEALMRWQHPERGWVPPNSFIPLAEQSDLIVELGHFAIRQAVEAASHWPIGEVGSELPYVTVNLSAHQFLDPALLGTIESALASSGLAAERLVVEITESAMLLNVAETISVMERISALGIGFALDDFGTGYSSLSYLALLHPTIIKIDRSFVSPTKESARNDALLEAIISLGHKLGMTMLAEGIETENQLERLHNLGCEFGQGFYWSPAVANDKVGAMLQRHRRKHHALV